MKQVSPTLHLRVGAVPELPPDGVRRIGESQPLGNDALEVKPLDGPKEITALPWAGIL
jgi:hypothetical protein